MARGVNKVILVGNVGRDPEVRGGGDRQAVATLSLATTESWKDKNGEKVEKTEWHRVVAFGRTAEVVQQYVKKGMQLYVEGKLQTRKWQDKDGHERYTTEIVTSEIQFLGRKNSTSAESGGEPPSVAQSMGGNNMVPLGSEEDDPPPF